MIQCVSDSNPYDDEPDVIEEAETWLNKEDHKEDPTGDAVCHLNYARQVIEGLLDYIEENV